MDYYVSHCGYLEQGGQQRKTKEGKTKRREKWAWLFSNHATVSINREVGGCWPDYARCSYSDLTWPGKSSRVVSDLSVDFSEPFNMVK